MIELTCAHCGTHLVIDDAFAGGVCRCQDCGAIQTVPPRPKPASGRTPAAQATRIPKPKTLYRASPGIEPSSGPRLEGILPDIDGLLTPEAVEPVQSPLAPPAPRRRRLWILLLILTLLALIATAVWYATRQP